LIVLFAIMWIVRWSPSSLPISYGMVAGTFPLLPFYLGLIIPTVGRKMIGVFPRGSITLVPVALLIFVGRELANCYADFHPGGLITINETAFFEVMIPLACFYLIAWLIYGPHRPVRELLRRPEFLFLGRTSYSIYVFHFPIAAAVAWHVRGLPPMARLAIGIATVVPVTLAISALCYRYVELPFIRHGRALAAAVAAKRSDDLTVKLNQPA